MNTPDAAHLEEARKKLLEQRSLLRGYRDTLTISKGLISEELWIGFLYNGDGVVAADKNKNIKFVIPKEGTQLWVDNMCIPRDAPHKYTAEVFINYILEPKVSADIANHIRYANCNAEAEVYMLREVLDDPAIYPPKEVLNKCEFFRQDGSEEETSRREQAINRIWSELQAENK